MKVKLPRYRVRATIREGVRITTDKFWLSRKDAQKYADTTNTMYRGARARVVKVK